MSTATLTRTYQLLLRAYSPATRAGRGSVELDTLLATSDPNQRLPKLRETRAILREGIRDRIAVNAGRSTLEIVSYGATLGVLLTMSMQLGWLGMMLPKVVRSPGAAGPFTVWAAVLGALAFALALRPMKRTLVLWQLANVAGGVWLWSFVRRETPGVEDYTFLAMIVAPVTLLALSSVVVLFCWDKLPKTQRVALGWRIGLACVVVPLWASPLSPIDSSGLQVAALAVVAMLVIALVDPRPLIAMAIALGTPLVAASLAMQTLPRIDAPVRIVVPAITVVIIALFTFRTRVLLRRLDR
jgi:hypothetical protein